MIPFICSLNNHWYHLITALSLSVEAFHSIVHFTSITSFTLFVWFHLHVISSWEITIPSSNIRFQKYELFMNLIINLDLMSLIRLVLVLCERINYQKLVLCVQLRQKEIIKYRRFISQISVSVSFLEYTIFPMTCFF